MTLDMMVLTEFVFPAACIVSIFVLLYVIVKFF